MTADAAGTKMAPMRPFAAVPAAFWLFLGAGCASELPSAVPLGSGPLAGEPVRATSAPHQDLAATTQHDSDSDQDSDEAETASSAGEQPDASPPGSSDAKPPSAGDTRPADSAAQPRSQPPHVDPAGRYAGNDFTRARVDGRPEFRAEDPNAKTDVAETKSGVDITVLNSANLVPMCTLHAKLNGSQAVIDPGQTCDLGLGVIPSIRSGTADFSGKHLHFEVRADIDADTDEGHVHGDCEYRFDGDRQ